MIVSWHFLCAVYLTLRKRGEVLSWPLLPGWQPSMNALITMCQLRWMGHIEYAFVTRLDWAPTRQAHIRWSEEFQRHCPKYGTFPPTMGLKKSPDLKCCRSILPNLLSYSSSFLNCSWSLHLQFLVSRNPQESWPIMIQDREGCHWELHGSSLGTREDF